MNIKKYGTVSYNIYCNFTNYGSALQTWALQKTINKLGEKRWEAVLVDYCPDILADKDPFNPIENMWDKDEETIKMIELSMPAIKENYYKFENFYKNQMNKTVKKYTSQNFNDVVTDEKIDGFVCGSDTIFCPDEFGFDDGYYANFECMKNGSSVAYAASFGDPHFDDEKYMTLNGLLQNFKAIGLRENMMLQYVKDHTDVPVQKVLDPTLLLTSKDYDTIAEKRLKEEKYLLMYSRRYNPQMEEYAEKIAKENGWKIVDISLRASNDKKGHIMYYQAGVEEFLSLVKYSEFVVTNSFHGMIFAVQYQRDFVVFTREQANTKIMELLELFGISDRAIVSGKEKFSEIDYNMVNENIAEARKSSLSFLEMELSGLQ